MKYFLPKRIIKYNGNIENIENLCIKKTLQIGLYEPIVTHIVGNGYVILDFGEEICGGIRILTQSVKGEARMRIRFGESITETCANLGEKNATNDHSIRDLTVDLPKYSDITLGQTGFRFIRLNFISGEFKIKSILAASNEEEREYIGGFISDDDLLNRIWNTAAKTLSLCVRNGYIWDGIKRDRLVWIGDIYPEAKAAYALYGNIPEIKNSLEFCRDQTPDGAWMNGFPTYSAWWIINLCEYYFQSGDKEFVIKNSDFIERIVNQIANCIDESGNVNFPFYFIDWATNYTQSNNETQKDLIKKHEEAAGTNYLLRITFKKVIPLLQDFGLDSKVATNAMERLCKKSYTVKEYKQIAALGVYAGEITEENKKVMLNGGAKGLTTFLNYFIFGALDKFGEHGEVIEMIKEYYGKMISLGATTFWEDFDITWAENAYGIDELPVKGKKDIHGDYGRFCYTGYRHSLCHGWSSGVLAYMSEYILGVEKVSENKYSVKPNLIGLNKLKGTYPTPFGKIEIYAERQKNGEISINITAPKGITII